MAVMDYYKILGIDKKASSAQIKKAYRKLARKYHPDINPNDKTAEIKFKEINEANEVLSHTENRTKYDKYGGDWKHADQFEQQQQQQQQQQGQRSSAQGFGGDGFGDTDFSDYFESMFGGAAGGRAGRVGYKGQDLNAELRFELREVYESQKQVLTVNGKKIRITIPAGIENGQVIKIAGKGSPGSNGGPNGDLYLQFIVKNHSSFKREGNQLYAQVNLDLYTAVLGGELMIETFNGKVKLKIKPGTQGEEKVKLKGKGFPVYRQEGKFGDLIITFKLETPTQLTPKEKELFEELQKLR